MGMAEDTIYSLVAKENPGNPLAYVRDIVRPLSMNKLTECLKNCNDCKIGNDVRSIPYGNPNGSILILRDFIQEQDITKDYVYPYDEEKPYDKALCAVLEANALDMDQIIWLNAVNCCPHEMIEKRFCPRLPNQFELKNCRVFADFAIQSFAPVFIFLMGTTALSLFLDTKISEIHGHFITVNGVTAMPVYSPEYLAMISERMPESYPIYERIFKEDMKRAADFLRQEYPILIKSDTEEGGKTIHAGI